MLAAACSASFLEYPEPVNCFDFFIETFSIQKKVLKDLEYGKIDQWDSIALMTLMSDLEYEFKITFENDDIIDFSSYKKGKEILKKFNIII